MALVVTFRLPTEACKKIVPGYGTAAVDTSGIRSAVKNVLIAALDEGIDPLPIEVPPSTPTERINLSLDESIASKVRPLSKDVGVADSIICQRILLSMINTRPHTTSEIIPPGCELLEEAWEKTPRFSQNLAQAQVFLNIDDALSGGHIAMVEAATGVGKTTAILLAAEKRLANVPDSIITIAVPTIAIMRQFFATHRTLSDNGVPVSPIETIFGKREFVSVEVLHEVIQNPKYIDHKDRILAWIGLQGEPMPDSQFEKPWLISTLKSIAPGFPAESCALPDIIEENDPGFQAYKAQFKRENRPDKEILLCTHAMLSVSTKHRQWGISSDETYAKMKGAEAELKMRLRNLKGMSDAPSAQARSQLSNDIKQLENERLIYGSAIGEDLGKLPHFRHLIIDEAHQFEAAMSSANSFYLSIQSFLEKVKACQAAGLGISLENVKKITQEIERLKGIAAYEKNDSITMGTDTKGSVITAEAFSAIVDLSAPGRIKKKNLDAKSSYLLQQLEYGRLVIRNAVNNASSRHAVLKFSPVREYPQLYVGSSTVNSMMSTLWASVKAAVCISATLYIPREDGYSNHFFRKVMNIPDGRLKDYPPVAPYWLYESVSELHMPAHGTHGIAPPSRSDKLSQSEMEIKQEQWLSNVAKEVQEIHQTAAGGTMVLMTSYSSINQIKNMLPQEFKDSHCIFASLDATITEQSIAFLKLAYTEKKPVWFATGAAWTGVDIGGHAPLRDLIGKEELPVENDNILTDLIIPRIPFGLNKSITHEYRIKREPGTPWEILDTLIRFKQGLGRLIRRRGLPKNRRIFLLDSRIYKPGFEFIRKKIETICQVYPVVPPSK